MKKNDFLARPFAGAIIFALLLTGISFAAGSLETALSELEQYKLEMPALLQGLEQERTAAESEYNGAVASFKEERDASIAAIDSEMKEAGVTGWFVSGEKAEMKKEFNARKQAAQDKYELACGKAEDRYSLVVEGVNLKKDNIEARLDVLELNAGEARKLAETQRQREAKANLERFNSDLPARQDSLKLEKQAAKDEQAKKLSALKGSFDETISAINAEMKEAGVTGWFLSEEQAGARKEFEARKAAAKAQYEAECGKTNEKYASAVEAAAVQEKALLEQQKALKLAVKDAQKADKVAVKAALPADAEAVQEAVKPVVAQAAPVDSAKEAEKLKAAEEKLQKEQAKKLAAAEKQKIEAEKKKTAEQAKLEKQARLLAEAKVKQDAALAKAAEEKRLKDEEYRRTALISSVEKARDDAAKTYKSALDNMEAGYRQSKKESEREYKSRLAALEDENQATAKDLKKQIAVLEKEGSLEQAERLKSRIAQANLDYALAERTIVSEQGKAASAADKQFTEEFNAFENKRLADLAEFDSVLEKLAGPLTTQSAQDAQSFAVNADKARQQGESGNPSDIARKDTQIKSEDAKFELGVGDIGYSKLIAEGSDEEDVIRERIRVMESRRRNELKEVKVLYKNQLQQDRQNRSLEVKYAATKEQKQAIDKSFENLLDSRQEVYAEKCSSINNRYDYLALETSVPLGLETQQDKTKYGVSSIEIEGNDLFTDKELLSGLPAVVEVGSGEAAVKVNMLGIHKAYLGQCDGAEEVGANEILALVQYVLGKYADYSGIFVYVSKDTLKPDGGFKDDKLVLTVVEGKTGDVIVRKNVIDDGTKLGYVTRPEGEASILNETWIKKNSPYKEGDVINPAALDRYATQLNRNGDVFVQPIVSKGEGENELGLNYNLYEARRWHLFAQIDNSGSEKRQWSPTLGVINTNVTGHNDNLSLFYQAALLEGSSDVVEENFSFFGSYMFPMFSPYLRTQLYYAYSDFDSDSQSTQGLVFRGNGEMAGAKMFWNIAKWGTWMVDLTGSISEETSFVDTVFGSNNFANDVDLSMVGGGVELSQKSKMYNSVASLNYLYNYDGSDAQAFDNARTKAVPDFDMIVAGFNHSQFLDKEQAVRLKLRTDYTKASDRLIPAKMTTFGGMNSVRGYEEDEIVADGGFKASLQLEYDILKPWPWGEAKEDEAGNDGGTGFFDRLALAAFSDYGNAEMLDPVAGEDKSRQLLSVGAGVVFRIGNRLDGEIYCGYPLEETESTDQGDEHWNFRVIYRW